MERKNLTLTMDEGVLEKLREEKLKTGMPISRQLENAWRKEHD